jgi:hypothetical protein
MKKSGSSEHSSIRVDLASALLSALRQKFPDHFQVKEPQIHLVEVPVNQTPDQALETFKKANPEANDQDLFVFSYITGGGGYDVSMHMGEKAIPTFQDPEISGMLHEMEKQAIASLPQDDPDARPEALKGLSWGEIVALQADGRLTPAEEEWLSFKDIPDPRGGVRMPNLKALARRAQRAKLNS